MPFAACCSPENSLAEHQSLAGCQRGVSGAEDPLAVYCWNYEESLTVFWSQEEPVVLSQGHEMPFAVSCCPEKTLVEHHSSVDLLVGCQWVRCALVRIVSQWPVGFDLVHYL